MSHLRTISGLALLGLLALAVSCTVDPEDGSPRAKAGGSIDAPVAPRMPIIPGGTDEDPKPSIGVMRAPQVCLLADATKRAPGAECGCDNDCTTGTCSDGVCCTGAACGAKRASGGKCGKADECQSGFCVDGVCCNTACSGGCVSCNQPDNMGDCQPVGPGVPDPHGICRKDSPDTCGQSGLCNSQGGCAKYRHCTICKLGGCDGKASLVPSSVCDGDGACIFGVAVACSPSTCDVRNCRTTCTVDADCVAPNVCKKGSCGKFGPGQDCTTNAQCKSGFCV